MHLTWRTSARQHQGPCRVQTTSRTVRSVQVTDGLLADLVMTSWMTLCVAEDHTRCAPNCHWHQSSKESGRQYVICLVWGYVLHVATTLDHVENMTLWFTFCLFAAVSVIDFIYTHLFLYTAQNETKKNTLSLSLTLKKNSGGITSEWQYVETRHTRNSQWSCL